MTLPCKHDDRVTQQVHPTINLLTNMDELHPEILRQHDIEPVDYKSGLVFRSAIESIRGTFIASSTTGREGMVGDVLENLLQREVIADYKKTGGTNRHDFEVMLQHNPDYFVALEVKGGEGNSINISERPLWAKEFGVWSHLDGSIVNPPEHGAHSVINRLTNELVKRRKQVDVLFFKDLLCGTRTRPCPKYPGKESSIGLNTAPDIFLFPQHIPTVEDPMPPVHTLETLKLPKLILGLFDVDEALFSHHIWEVQVRVEELTDDRLKRYVRVHHQGQIVSESVGRPWRP